MSKIVIPVPYYRRTCIYGGGNTGKSVLAAYLFCELKKLQYNIELVTEKIKPWAWNKRLAKSWDQLKLFSSQLLREDNVLRNDGIIVSDSPLYMSITYSRSVPEMHGTYDALSELCKIFDKKYPAINIFLERVFEYQKLGRYGKEESSKHMDGQIRSTLDRHCIQYIVMDPSKPEKILEYVVSQLQVYPKCELCGLPECQSGCNKD